MIEIWEADSSNHDRRLLQQQPTTPQLNYNAQNQLSVLFHSTTSKSKHQCRNQERETHPREYREGTKKQAHLNTLAKKTEAMRNRRTGQKGAYERGREPWTEWRWCPAGTWTAGADMKTSSVLAQDSGNPHSIVSRKSTTLSPSSLSLPLPPPQMDGGFHSHPMSKTRKGREGETFRWVLGRSSWEGERGDERKGYVMDKTDKEEEKKIRGGLEGLCEMWILR